MTIIKVLHVVSSLGGGGVAQTLVNYFEHLDHKKISFDFIVHSDEVGVHENYFSKLGSNIFRAPPKRSALFKNYMVISRIIRDGNYDVVHAHQNLASVVPLMLAKYYKVPVRISHGHGYPNTLRPVASLIKKAIEFSATSYFACTADVGEWLHPHQWKKQSQSSFVMRNAFDISRFAFSPGSRADWRTRLQLGSVPTIIQVGRLSPEKNHAFTISLFSRLSSRAAWRLIIVGDGPLEKSLKNQVKGLGLTDKVSFLGYQNDIAGILSAADLAVMPSTSEGLGLAAVEAQAAALPVFVSTAIPREVKVTDSIYFLPLDITAWVEAVTSKIQSRSQKNQIFDDRLQGYAIAPAADSYLNYVTRALVKSKNDRR